jgi:hypothetical protein
MSFILNSRNILESLLKIILKTKKISLKKSPCYRPRDTSGINNKTVKARP